MSEVPHDRSGREAWHPDAGRAVTEQTNSIGALNTFTMDRL